MKNKKIPLKIICLMVLSVMLMFWAVLLCFKLYKNHEYVKAFDNSEYLIENEKALLFANLPESYLPYYNLGNAAYENGDYNSAVGY